MKSIVSILLCSTLFGCSAEPPACNDPKILDLVKSTVEEIGDGVATQYKSTAQDLATVSVDRVVLSGYKKEIGQRQCQAMLKLSPNKDRSLFARGVQSRLAGASAELLYAARSNDFIQQFSVLNLMTQNAVFPDSINIPLEYLITKTEGASGQYQISVKSGLAPVYYRTLSSLEKSYLSSTQPETKVAVVPKENVQTTTSVVIPKIDPSYGSSVDTNRVLRVDMVGGSYKCGEEAICFKSPRRVYTANSYSLGMIGLKALTENTNKTLCLRGVVVVDDKSSTYESVEVCS